MRVVSHPEADEEVEAAALWYEELSTRTRGVIFSMNIRLR